MWIRYTLALVLLALTGVLVNGQSSRGFTATQRALLNQLFFEKSVNSIDGSYLVEDSVEIDKLSFFVVTNELDPVFVASVAYRITADDTNKWHATDTKVFNTSNHFATVVLKFDAHTNVLDALDAKFGAHTNVLDAFDSDITDLITTSAVITTLANTNSYFITDVRTNVTYHATNTPQFLTNSIVHLDPASNIVTNTFTYWGVP